eukprot:m.28397 g.28397  ORF g.28397 m.28397 type:complete len:294 (-) comp8821_c0_seq1:31-912(-)
MGSDSCSNLVQFMSALSAIGIVMVGAVLFHNTAGALGLEWCKSDSRSGRRDCWTENINTRAALTMYAITLIFLGALALATELNAKDLKRPPGFLIFPGLLALGASRNLGIVVGSIAMFFGVVQVIIWLATGQTNGRFKIGGGHMSQVTVVLTQLFVLASSIGVSAVGIMVIVALSRNAEKAGLKWFEPSDAERSWFGHGEVTGEDFSEYALGAYGAALVLLGILNALANLKVLHRSLQSWSLLGPCGLMLGVLAFGGAGNTGILVGAFMMASGFVQWILAILYDQKDGYMSLS